MLQVYRQVMRAKIERWVSGALYNAVKVIFCSFLKLVYQFFFDSRSMLMD